MNMGSLPAEERVYPRKILRNHTSRAEMHNWEKLYQPNHKTSPFWAEENQKPHTRAKNQRGGEVYPRKILRAHYRKFGY
jgi:hypothetical protein